MAKLNIEYLNRRQLHNLMRLTNHQMGDLENVAPSIISAVSKNPGEGNLYNAKKIVEVLSDKNVRHAMGILDSSEAYSFLLNEGLIKEQDVSKEDFSDHLSYAARKGKVRAFVILTIEHKSEKRPLQHRLFTEEVLKNFALKKYRIKNSKKEKIKKESVSSAARVEDPNNTLLSMSLVLEKLNTTMTNYITEEKELKTHILKLQTENTALMNHNKWLEQQLIAIETNKLVGNIANESYFLEDKELIHRVAKRFENGEIPSWHSRDTDMGKSMVRFVREGSYAISEKQRNALRNIANKNYSDPKFMEFHNNEINERIGDKNG